MEIEILEILKAAFYGAVGALTYVAMDNIIYRRRLKRHLKLAEEAAVPLTSYLSESDNIDYFSSEVLCTHCKHPKQSLVHIHQCQGHN